MAKLSDLADRQVEEAKGNRAVTNDDICCKDCLFRYDVAERCSVYPLSKPDSILATHETDDSEEFCWGYAKEIE